MSLSSRNSQTQDHRLPLSGTNHDKVKNGFYRTLSANQANKQSLQNIRKDIPLNYNSARVTLDKSWKQASSFDSNELSVTFRRAEISPPVLSPKNAKESSSSGNWESEDSK